MFFDPLVLGFDVKDRICTSQGPLIFLCIFFLFFDIFSLISFQEKERLVRWKGKENEQEFFLLPSTKSSTK